MFSTLSSPTPPLLIDANGDSPRHRRRPNGAPVRLLPAGIRPARNSPDGFYVAGTSPEAARYAIHGMLGAARLVQPFRPAQLVRPPASWPPMHQQDSSGAHVKQRTPKLQPNGPQGAASDTTTPPPSSAHIQRTAFQQPLRVTLRHHADDRSPTNVLARPTRLPRALWRPIWRPRN
jgi:hypothetical protein